MRLTTQNAVPPGSRQSVTPAGTVKPGWTTSEFWQTLLVTLIAAAVALGSVIKPGFNLNGLQAIVPAVALFAAAIAQGFYSHSRSTVKAAAQVAASSLEGGVPKLDPSVSIGQMPTPPPIIVNVGGNSSDSPDNSAQS
jgi:hypothetical protein